MHITKDLSQKERVATLAAVGYATNEIAAMVGTSTHVVSQALYESRKKKPKRRRTNGKSKN